MGVKKCEAPGSRAGVSGPATMCAVVIKCLRMQAGGRQKRSEIQTTYMVSWDTSGCGAHARPSLTKDGRLHAWQMPLKERGEVDERAWMGWRSSKGAAHLHKGRAG